MATISAIEPAFHQLSDLLREYPNSLPFNELHGFLTGVAVAGNYIDVIPWRQKLLGMAEFVGSEVIPEKLHELIDHVIYDIEAQLEEGFFLPIVTTEKMGGVEVIKTNEWAKGFLSTVCMIEADWEQLTGDNPYLGRQLLAMNMIADIETFAPLYFKKDVDIREPEFIKSIRELAGPAAISMFNIIATEEIMPANDEIVAALAEMNALMDEQRLDAMSDAALMQLIQTVGDTLPIQVVNEFQRREATILPLVTTYMVQDNHWYTEDGKQWWGVLHGIFILGKMQSVPAAHALLGILKQQEKDLFGEIWDWVAGYWPALLGTKIQFVRDDLLAMAQDIKCGSYVKYNVLQCLLYHAQQQGEKNLNEMLDLVAAAVESIPVDDEGRYLIASIFLDFPRQRYKRLMEKLVVEQEQAPTLARYFDSDSIESRFGQGDEAEWLQFANPWKFYEVHEIMKRQLRWADEIDEDEDEAENWLYDNSVIEPFMREVPKVGRNDLCPCGSGKKYKKCCLH